MEPLPRRSSISRYALRSTSSNVRDERTRAANVDWFRSIALWMFLSMDFEPPSRKQLDEVKFLEMLEQPNRAHNPATVATTSLSHPPLPVDFRCAHSKMRDDLPICRNDVVLVERRSVRSREERESPYLVLDVTPEDADDQRQIPLEQVVTASKVPDTFSATTSMRPCPKLQKGRVQTPATTTPPCSRDRWSRGRHEPLKPQPLASPTRHSRRACTHVVRLRLWNVFQRETKTRS